MPIQPQETTLQRFSRISREQRAKFPIPGRGEPVAPLGRHLLGKLTIKQARNLARLLLAGIQGKPEPEIEE